MTKERTHFAPKEPQVFELTWGSSWIFGDRNPKIMAMASIALCSWLPMISLEYVYLPDYAPNIPCFGQFSACLKNSHDFLSKSQSILGPVHLVFFFLRIFKHIKARSSRLNGTTPKNPHVPFFSRFFYGCHMFLFLFVSKGSAILGTLATGCWVDPMKLLNFWWVSFAWLLLSPSFYPLIFSFIIIIIK